MNIHTIDVESILDNHEKWLRLETTDEMMRANFFGIDFSAYDFSYKHLRGVIFSYACLIQAQFMYAQLQGSNMSYANMQQADMRYAQLGKTNIQHANLSGVNLQYTFCRGMHMQYANLQNACLEYAVLDYCNCYNANCTGATYNKYTTGLECLSDEQKQSMIFVTDT